MNSAVFYALGGGRGHLTRALQLAEQTPAAVILHQVDHPPVCAAHIELLRIHPATTEKQLRDLLVSMADRYRCLVVDTFAAGVAHELTEAALLSFERRVLVRRYCKPGSYEVSPDVVARYDDVLLPYDKQGCEWDNSVAGDYVGPLVRSLGFTQQRADTVVIGEPEHIPPAWQDILRDATWINGPFSALPRARRIVATAAGHNLSYELMQLGLPFALLPQERRYDDQYRRADRLGAGIYQRSQLQEWLDQA